MQFLINWTQQFGRAIIMHFRLKVASTGIEPVSGASETLILSIVRRGLFRDCRLYVLSY